MAEQESSLSKGLGLPSVFCIASGAMISSGLFVLPGIAFGKAGPSTIIAYLIAGLLSLPGMLSIAEMATAMPKAGADCFTVIRSMGPGVGTVAGLLSWFSLSMKSAFALIGVSLLMAAITVLNMHTVAVVGCAVFLTINLVGVREAGRLQVLLATLLFILLGVYIAFGLKSVNVESFSPFVPHGLRSMFSVTGYVFISYAGLLKIASVAEEIRNPSRNIPLGMMSALLVVTIFYSLVVFVTVGVLPASELAGSQTPISDGAAAFMGRPGYIALTVAGMLALLTTANAGIMTAARSLVPLSRDNLFPEVFSRINKRFGTPHNALLLTGAFIVASVFLKLDLLVEAASIVLILTNVLACISVLILHESGLQNYRPEFRAPLYPWLQAAGLIGYGFVLLEMGAEAYFITILISLAGFCTYWFYGRKRVQRESALLHLIERITARELVSGTLESELKGIVLERDEVTLDRFDQIVEECPVLDIEETMEVDEFFDLAGQKLAERMDEDSDRISKALKEREKDGSTVLTPNLAVPHIVIDGDHEFEVLLARCRDGVRFSEEAQEVKAVFVLVGTKDERNFYLNALSAIAQVAGHMEFMDRWMNARGPQGLRDVVVLGKRSRS
mgnify:FL=1